MSILPVFGYKQITEGRFRWEEQTLQQNLRLGHGTQQAL